MGFFGPDSDSDLDLETTEHTDADPIGTYDDLSAWDDDDMIDDLADVEIFDDDDIDQADDFEPDPAPEEGADEPDTFEPIGDMPPDDLDTPEEEEETPAPVTAPRSRKELARELQEQTGAIRVSFTWLGTTKALEDHHKRELAEHFNASARSVTASKKIIDSRNPRLRALTKIKGQIAEYWHAETLPYVEPGIRLIHTDRIPAVTARLDEYREELDAAARELADARWEIMADAQDRLGDLYDPADYPADLSAWFGVSWDFPNVSPPDYLAQIRPDIYEAEKAKIQARFEEAVRLAEEAFAQEFTDLLHALVERITVDSETGEKKVFKDSTVNNLKEFFDRFKTLNVRSNPELDALIEQAQSVIGDKTPDALRKNYVERDAIRAQLADVATALAGLTGKAPRRKITRKSETRDPETADV